MAKYTELSGRLGSGSFEILPAYFMPSATGCFALQWLHRAAQEQLCKVRYSPAP